MEDNSDSEDKTGLIRIVEENFLRFKESGDADLKNQIERDMSTILERLGIDKSKVPIDIGLNIAKLAEICDELGLEEQRKPLDHICRTHYQRSVDNGKKIDRKEWRLEEYLTQGHLEEIEEGLKYIGHEVAIVTGRVDIYALDKDDKKVVIELKARDYRSSELDHQARKYLEELRQIEEDPRVIIVAPKIKDDLFAPLRPYSEKGEITFFEVSEKKG
ncbi:DUF91 domain-containing protein, partial [Candidatus Woesearchaeota archaeon]|nr:DUF91 domain-containing protein [Candidatus Woesearchaeota archaeon]